MYRLTALLFCVLVSGWGFCDDAKNVMDPKLGKELEERMHKASDCPLRITAKRYVPGKGTLGLAIASCEYDRPDDQEKDSRRNAFAGFVVTDNGVPMVTLDTLPFNRKGVCNDDVSYIPREASEGQVTLDAPEEYRSDYVSRIKLFFDLKDKKNLGHREYQIPCVNTIVVKGKTVWCAMRAWTVMDEKRQTVSSFIAKIRLDTEDYKPELLTQINGTPIPDLRDGCVKDGNLVFSGEHGDMVLSGETWKWNPRATLGVKGPLRWRTDITSSDGIPAAELRACKGVPNGSIVRIESTGITIVSEAGGAESYPVGEVTREFLYKMRPDLGTDRFGGGADYYPNNGIGAWAIDGDHVVFGTRFYSGEGEEGVGAVGDFDLRTRTYRYEYPPLLAAWSTPTLLLDGGTLWMGLVGYGEGGSWSGGLLRYNRKDRSSRVYDIPANIVQVVKAWDRLLIATIDGLYILKEDKLTRIQGTVDVDGKPYLDVRPVPDRLPPITKRELRITVGRIGTYDELR